MRYSIAMRAASMAASKQSDGDCGAMTGTGDSPLRPNIACSRSDCSVLVGRPVDGPPRCTSTMISGSSRETARPIASDLSATPGPDVVVTPSAPPYAAPMAAPMPAISSSAWKVVTPNVWFLAQLVQDVRRRGDRVRAEEQRQPGTAATRRSGRSASAGLPVMLRYVARRHRRRCDLVLDREGLRGLAERPARLERGQVRGEDLGLACELAAQELERALGRARSTASDSRPSANMFFARSASFLRQVEKP